jgi:hypothetical protein
LQPLKPHFWHWVCGNSLLIASIEGAAFCMRYGLQL